MSSPRFTFQLQTYGCKVNTYDSGLLQKRLQAFGAISPQEAPQVHILNTCAVTQEATKEALRQARRLKSKNPECTVVLTGCAAQVDTDSLSASQAVDLVVANSHKGQLEEIIARHLDGGLGQERVFKSNIFKKLDLESGGGLEDHHTRSFLKIQDGCNSFCTFCVIPMARGKSRSISIKELTAKVNELSDRGIQEVVLTGVHIGDYEDKTQKDSGGLEDLVQSLLEETSVSRIRLSSLEPVELSERLLSLFENNRLCPHFHMSIQSAESKVLKEMKRQYTHREVESSLNQIALRFPQAYVGMDVIAGFPGESQKEFEETYERLNRLPWTRLHVFPYSQRPSTLAARRADQWEPRVIQNRASQLRSLSSERLITRATQQVGQVKQVLVLKSHNNLVHGLSRDFWKISFEGEGFQPGEEVSVQVTHLEKEASLSREGRLLGRVFS